MDEKINVEWTKDELDILEKLDTPEKIQEFLDNVPYNTDPFARSPREVLLDRKAHCFDGALFAALALNRIGFPPMIVDMVAEKGKDDDHVLAVFKKNGRWGAVAKSNFVGLRFRDPVYSSVRELVMSYFDTYFNLDREKTLRSYSVPFDLREATDLNWMIDKTRLDDLSDRLEAVKHFTLFTPKMIDSFVKIDDRTFKAQTLGLDPAGAYKTKK